jgi:hypothetical protein
MAYETEAGNRSILDLLHQDHEEALQLIDKIIEEDDGAERTGLFNELRKELTAHLDAESRVLYARMAKQDENEEGHHFALEGDIEHELVEAQLEVLGRSRNKSDENWTTRLEVVRELVLHHVEEEEEVGHKAAREMFDENELAEFGEEFAKAKERLMSGGGPRARKAASAALPHAASKPRAARAKAGRTPARRRKSRR